MDDLIEALTIFKKYIGPNGCYAPTHCEHDEMYVCCVNPSDVSPEDITRLDDLGFVTDGETFYSFRFGSC